MEIGLDIGGTKIYGALYNKGETVRDLTIVTPKTLFEFKHNLTKLVGFLRGREKVVKIGISMAGLMNREKAVAVSSPNIKYIQNLDFGSFLEKFKTIKLDNDASCFLRAEIKYGEVKRYKNVIGLIYGTGIGGGLFLDGKFYRGFENFGGEVGRIPFGNSNWEAEFQKLRDKRDFGALAKLTEKNLFVLVMILNPQAIVFGGSVATKEGSKFIPKALRELSKNLSGKQAVPKVFISKLKNSGALGAVLLLK